MELKSAWSSAAGTFFVRSNRTFMELKYNKVT